MLDKVILMVAVLLLAACGSNKGTAVETVVDNTPEVMDVVFDADSAWNNVNRQVEFGPRVPNSDAHRKCGDWLVAELKRHGAEVTEQKADLKAFDGTVLKARNIFASFNPDKKDRILLLAHWDTRPWADKDPDVSKRKMAVDGANDGASGVGVLLEIARCLKRNAPQKGVDILFVDAEDWGTDNDEDSWAMGAKYFMEHPIKDGYMPSEAILLDMVGGTNAQFCREYFSEQAAPQLASAIWSIASQRGYGEIFRNRMGGAVTDDHVQLIRHGIPTVDIIEYNPDNDSGFNSRWHTTSDNMQGISRETLKAVGEVVTEYISRKTD